MVPKLSANLIAEHFLINCFSSSSVSTLYPSSVAWISCQNWIRIFSKFHGSNNCLANFYLQLLLFLNFYLNSSLNNIKFLCPLIFFPFQSLLLQSVHNALQYFHLWIRHVFNQKSIIVKVKLVILLSESRARRIKLKFKQTLAPLFRVVE